MMKHDECNSPEVNNVNGDDSEGDCQAIVLRAETVSDTRVSHTFCEASITHSLSCTTTHSN